MKRFFKHVSVVLILLCAASCNPAEINNDTPDNPQNPEQPGQPQQSELKFSASILKTRVDYSNEDGDSLNPVWEVGDVLYGFYGDDTDHSIILRVVSVDESGKASLNLEYITGSVANITDETSVHLIYTGAHIESGASITPSDYAFTDEGRSVSLTSQNPPRIPVCMSASAKPTNSGGDRYISFSFQKDCAIIEIDGLPGLAEDWSITSETALSGITVSGLCLNGKYTFNNEELTFGADNSAESSSSISFTGYKVDSKGAIENSSGSKILIAVVPNGSQTFTIKASTAEKQDISIHYEDKTLEKDKCYVITAKPVVAKIDFGSETKYYQSVAAAFDDAYYAYDGEGVSGLTVILIKDQIEGLGTQMSHDWSPGSTIVIDYPVSLDLNGCTLNLSGTEGFEVGLDDSLNPVQFTVKDSQGLDEGQYIGTIKSTSYNPLINNSGILKIDGGNLLYTFDDGETYDYQMKSMIYNAGTITIDNESYLQSDGNPVEEDEDFSIINNQGTLTIASGCLRSYDLINSIDNNSGTVTISGGTITSKKCCAIVNYGDLTISGDASVSSSSSEKPTIDNWSTLDVDDGRVFSSSNNAVYCHPDSEIHIGEDDGNLTPEIVSTTTDYLDDYFCYRPAIFLEAATLSMNRGTISGYIENDDETLGTATAIYVDSDSQCDISGGIIESIVPAIVSDGEVNVTGGDYYSDGDSAIVSYGTLTVGDPEIGVSDRKSINITSNFPGDESGLSFCPAIYCSAGGKFDMHYGTVTGPTGAVAVENTEAIIYGGYFESEDGYTVSVNYGSDCTIKGGIYYKKGTYKNPTLFCSSWCFGTEYTDSEDNEKGDTVLTIEWPESTETKDGYITNLKTNIREPLIYCVAPTNSNECSASPVGAYLIQPENNPRPNYASVYIKGGYLFTHTNYFFGGTKDCDILKNGTGEFGGFYANTYVLSKNAGGTGSGNDVDLSTTAFGDKNWTVNDETAFTPDFVLGLPTETSLYYIE